MGAFMALGPRLDLRQSQSLVMTPQLQQAIKLLTLSNLELEGFISSEIEKNPLLEAGEQEVVKDRDGDSGADLTEGDFADESAPPSSDELISLGQGQADSPLDVDHVAETFHHDSPSDSILDNGSDNAGNLTSGMDGSLNMDGPASGSSSGVGGESPDFDNFLSEELSLHDHLRGQAGEVLSDKDLFIALHLIDQVDDAGYMSADLQETAYRLSIAPEDAERVLFVIHGFDPCGVGARSLSECLALQAKEADRYDPAMARLIDNLEMLARGSLPQLCRTCGVDEEDMADMISELRNYDPKPGGSFGGGAISAVVPDVFIAERKEGWAIEINSATLPRVLVDRQYYAELAGGSHDKASKAWLNECLADANWLVKALDQRQRTIVKVASEIVKLQEEFFRKGVEHLKPLTLKVVAEAIEMHESTISRVTSNKYISCARGLYEMKYFFTSGIQSSEGGDAVSAEAVKSHIKSLIDNEDKILSDDKLVELLKAKGFDIARRTVAKYREALGIGSSVQRRRQKKLNG